jgi:hypothetical protein
MHQAERQVPADVTMGYVVVMAVMVAAAVAYFARVAMANPDNQVKTGVGPVEAELRAEHSAGLNRSQESMETTA